MQHKYELYLHKPSWYKLIYESKPLMERLQLHIRGHHSLWNTNLRRYDRTDLLAMRLFHRRYQTASFSGVKLTNEIWSSLKNQLAYLRNVEINNVRLTEMSAKGLKKLGQLESLKLIETTIIAPTFKPKSDPVALTSLKSLIFEDSSWFFLRYIRCESLEQLVLNHAKEKPEFFEDFMTSLPRLNELSINSEFDDLFCFLLKLMHKLKLKKFSIKRAAINESVTAALSRFLWTQMLSLEQLDLILSSSDEAIYEFVMPYIKAKTIKLSSSSLPTSDSFYSMVPVKPSLETLELCNGEINTKVVKNLLAICTGLVCMKLQAKVTCKMLQIISSTVPNLKHLHITQTDKACAESLYLDMMYLQTLRIEECFERETTDKTILHCYLPSLQRLEILSTGLKLTRALLEDLKHNCPHLRSLHLFRSPASEEFLSSYYDHGVRIYMCPTEFKDFKDSFAIKLYIYPTMF
jgi:hypothetical protein